MLNTLKFQVNLAKSFLHQKKTTLVDRIKRGFTLIEVLVVISIVGILAVVTAAIFTGVLPRVRDAKRLADMDAIYKAYEIKKNPLTGVYTKPDGADFADGRIPNTPEGGDYANVLTDDYNFYVCTGLEAYNSAQLTSTCDPANESCACCEGGLGCSGATLAYTEPPPPPPPPPPPFEEQGNITAVASFNSIGIEIPSTTAPAASLKFKRDTDPENSWRDGLPLWQAGGGLFGSVLLLNPGTRYYLDITEATTGTIHRKIVTTNADNIPPASSLTPDRYVKADGDDAKDGTSEANAWKTLQKAVTTAPSGAVVQVGPGYYVSTTTARTQPMTIFAKNPVIDTADDNTKEPFNRRISNGGVIDPGFHSIVLPRSTDGSGAPAIIPPSSATCGPGSQNPDLPASRCNPSGWWELVTYNDPNPAETNTYPVWRLRNAPLTGIVHLGYSTARNIRPYRISVWERRDYCRVSGTGTPTCIDNPGATIGSWNTDDGTMNLDGNSNPTVTDIERFYLATTPVNWAKTVYRMQGHGGYNYGAWTGDEDGAGGTNDILLRLPDLDNNPATLDNPNNYYFTLGTDVESGGAYGLSFSGLSSCRVSGMAFWTSYRGLVLKQTANGCTFDHNYISGAKSAILMMGATGSQYGSGHVFEYNRLENTGLWDKFNDRNQHASDADWQAYLLRGLTIPWYHIKQNNLGNGNQAGGINGQTWHKNVVVRYNTCTGGFDCGSGDTGGSDKYSGSNVDIYGNLAYQQIDDAFDASDWNINYRYWNNKIEETLTFWSFARFAYGPAYIFRNTIWQSGNKGIAPDRALDRPQAPALLKYGDVGSTNPLGSQGKVYLLHNTIYSDDNVSVLDNNAGGCSTRCPIMEFKNNIFKVGGRVGTVLGGSDFWTEDYNDWSTSGSSTWYFDVFGTRYNETDKTFGLYRQNNNPDGANSNLRTCPAGFSSCPGSFTNPPNPGNNFVNVGIDDMHLTATSWFINKGTSIPNISDLPGINYQVTAPDLGAFESNF